MNNTPISKQAQRQQRREEFCIAVFQHACGLLAKEGPLTTEEWAFYMNAVALRIITAVQFKLVQDLAERDLKEAV